MAVTAQEFFAAKVNRPSEMTTAEWDLVRAESKARAFFMAAVTEAEILQINRDAAAKMLNGELSLQEARREIREQLERHGYVAKPGEEGTIKDLTTKARQDVMLKTNVALARGHAIYHKQLIARRAFPAKRMVRVRGVVDPRPWRQRWMDAERDMPEGRAGMNAGEMAALIDHPVWIRLSRFRLPYPPYDFNSGMGDEAVSRDEARALGLLSGAPPKKGPTETPVVNQRSGRVTVAPGMNSTLEATPRVTDEALKRKLEDDLRGLAKWSGDKLVYTDPNGTKPYHSSELPAVIGTPNSADVPLLQREALEAWAERGPEGVKPGTDKLYHFRRLVHRTIPMEERETPLLSTRRFDDHVEFTGALRELQPGARWEPVTRGFPFLAFRRGLPRASDFETVTEDGLALRIIVEWHASARDLTPCVEQLAAMDLHGRHVLFERGVAFRVVRVEQEAGVTNVFVREEVTE